MKEELFLKLKSSIKERQKLVDIARLHGLPYNTVRSIYALNIEAKEKSAHSYHRKKATSYVHLYRQKIELQREDCLLELSEENDVQPFLMANFLLVGLQQLYGLAAERTKAVTVKEWMEDTSLIDLSASGLDPARLRADIQLCIDNDDSFGPLVDLVKRNVGREFEALLAQHLLCVGVRFLHDGAVRAIHLSKTPDALLTNGLIVRGLVVHWVESKALFGDAETMRGHFSSQLMPYVHRYGPGLVVYW